MATYQFLLTAIPRKGVMEKFGYIPDKLPVDYPERKMHYQLKREGLLEEGDVFEDALTQEWWKSTDVQPMEIVHQIDKCFLRRRDGNDLFMMWKDWSPERDNDASLTIDAASGKIENLAFRADLREEGLHFLLRLLEIAKTYDWLLMDSNGNLSGPDIPSIKKLIETSIAFKFVQDPVKFIQELGDEQ